MKGVRFYFDYGSAKAKRRGGDAPNALALFTEQWNFGKADGNEPYYDALAAVTDERNSGVAGTQTSHGYLRSACKRVSQAEAYRVHPNLRARMEEDEERELDAFEAANSGHE